MKNIILLITLAFLCAQIIFAQCPDRNISLTTQEEVDSFAIKYPTCTKLFYGITISETDSIKNLYALENITSIKGDLSFYGTKVLTSLSGLEKLTSIGGNLSISQNLALVDLSGLDNLVSINGNFQIIKNLALKDLSGLDELFEIGSLSIYENPGLINLSGLENLYAINGEFRIKDNQALTTLTGLKNLYTIGDNFEVKNNRALTKFVGLKNLNSIEGYLSIADNIALKSLSGLENLSSISGSLGMYNNDLLADLTALQNLTSIGGSLSVRGNNALTSLSGLKNIVPTWLQIEDNMTLTDISSLKNIQSVTGNIEIVNNDALTNLSGLENLKSIGRDLHIEDNPVLIELSALKNLQSIDDFMSIKNNSSLINLLGLENIDSIGASLRISNNASLKNLMGLEGLQSIKRSLHIQNNVSLTDLSGLDNLDYISQLFIYNNPLLNNCSNQFICNYVASDNNHTIENNTQGCSSSIEIIENCKNLTQIKSLLFYDVNQNKRQDEEEPPFFDAVVTINPGNENIYQNKYNGLGIYYAEPKDYTVDLNESSIPDWNLTTDSLSYNLNLAEGDCETVTFGIYPNEFMSQSTSSISRLSDFICYDTIGYNISTKNTGTTLTKGIIWFKADTFIKAVEIIDEPDTIIAPYQYGWFFEDLFPSHTISKQIDLVIPGRSYLRDYFTFESFIEFIDQNGEHKSEKNIQETRLSVCACLERLQTTWCYDLDRDGLGDPNQIIVSCEQPTNFVTDCTDINDAVSVPEESIHNLINIYPNPSNGIFKIEIGNGYYSKTLISIYNANGQQIIEPAALQQNQKWLEYPYLDNGVYYIKVDLDGLVLRKKLVVAK